MWKWERDNLNLCECGRAKKLHDEKPNKKCQKKKGEKLTKGFQAKHEIIRVQGGLRELPLGMYSYVFPDECLDQVLTCFNARNCDTQNMSWLQGV